jgi:hypothetical protein
MPIGCAGKIAALGAAPARACTPEAGTFPVVGAVVGATPPLALLAKRASKLATEGGSEAAGAAAPAFAAMKGTGPPPVAKPVVWTCPGCASTGAPSGPTAKIEDCGVTLLSKSASEFRPIILPAPCERVAPTPEPPSPSDTGSASPLAAPTLWHVLQAMFLFPERTLSWKSACPSETSAGFVVLGDGEGWGEGVGEGATDGDPRDELRTQPGAKTTSRARKAREDERCIFELPIAAIPSCGAPGLAPGPVTPLSRERD